MEEELEKQKRKKKSVEKSLKVFLSPEEEREMPLLPRRGGGPIRSHRSSTINKNYCELHRFPKLEKKITY